MENSDGASFWDEMEANVPYGYDLADARPGPPPAPTPDPPPYTDGDGWLDFLLQFLDLMLNFFFSIFS